MPSENAQEHDNEATRDFIPGCHGCSSGMGVGPCHACGGGMTPAEWAAAQAAEGSVQ